MHHSSHLYVLDNGQLRQRPVSLLRREGDSVIVSGLQAGEKLVLTRLDLMVDGMAVRALD